MSKPIPKIMKYMTTVPMSIQKSTPLLEAAELMQKNHIRHLPVLYGKQIEGILSSTDVSLIRTLNGVDITKLKVYDCFTPNPYIVTPEAPLNTVLSEMAENKYGCTIVADNGNLVGIFTWIDALRAASELLETRLKK